ncbi:MAG: response regulator [Gemmataceae bacterium]
MEDNLIQREGLAVVLRQHGFAVLMASGCQEALDIVERSNPDLILLDMLMANASADGWWFLQQRKRHPRLASIPVLITTALTIASEEWVSSLGASELIRKPIDVEPLLAAIQRCLVHG